jgi:hypothetical protein
MKKYLLFILIISAFAACKKDSSSNEKDEGINIDGWNIKTIGNLNPTGDISAICDKSDKLHVCIDGSDDRFYYSTNKSGSWVTTKVFEKETSIFLTPSNDIAIDNDKHIHMVFSTYDNSADREAKLYYATDKSGEMTKEVVYTELSSILGGLGIAATKNGKVHIVFGNIDMQLVYLTNVSGSWVQTVIDSYLTRVRPRLAIDAEENIYVVYGKEGVLKMQLIDSSGSLVSNTVLDNSTEDTGWSPTIALNSETNAIYVTYWDNILLSLKLYNNGTIGTIEECIWPEGGIVIDNSGYFHISYNNISELKYATNKSGSLEIFSLPVLTATNRSDIVVESTGKVDIFYLDQESFDLSVISK